MIKLSQVTLCTVGGEDYKAVHQKVLNYSRREIEFGQVRNFIFPIKNIEEWNYTVIYELPKRLKTDFCILIHTDGFIVNPDEWEDYWLNFDYIGAPWPMPTDNYSYRDEDKNIIRVGNSVSLRSLKLMKLVATRPWKSYYGNTNEDGFICCHNRQWLETSGCTFAPLEVAKWFSRELDIPENIDVERPFAFHLHDTNPGRNIKFATLV